MVCPVLPSTSHTDVAHHMLIIAFWPPIHTVTIYYCPFVMSILRRSDIVYCVCDKGSRLYVLGLYSPLPRDQVCYSFVTREGYRATVVGRVRAIEPPLSLSWPRLFSHESRVCWDEFRHSIVFPELQENISSVFSRFNI